MIIDSQVIRLQLAGEVPWILMDQNPALITDGCVGGLGGNFQEVLYFRLENFSDV